MDSMELEREKGITIQSAATYCHWQGRNINIIDTPGHVDFTIEVERALRVLDSAILVVCGVSGVQSQTMTVDRQMRRYDIPRIAFINKLDRMGANPWQGIERMRSKLRQNAVALQMPIGLEGDLEGIIDLVQREAIFFRGPFGYSTFPLMIVELHLLFCSNQMVRDVNIPMTLLEEMEQRRREMIAMIANVDDEVGEYFLMEEDPPIKVLKRAIRRATISRTLVPVFMGAAYKNVGVQSLLDGVLDYLPNPNEVSNYAFTVDKNQNGSERLRLQSNSEAPLVALAFKLEESRYFGQLTFMRIYQGALTRGSTIINVNAGGRKVKVPRLVRMHAKEMEECRFSEGWRNLCHVWN